jgi:beta-glucosidase
LQSGHNLLLAHGRAVATLRSNSVLPTSIGIAPVGAVCYPATETPENNAAARIATFDDWDLGCWAPAWFSDPVFFGHYPAGALEKFGHAAPVFTDAEMKIIQQPIDVCALNFYNGRPVVATKTGWESVPHPLGHPRTAFDWPVTPAAFYWLIKFYYERYQKPIVITENGLSSIDWIDCDGEIKDTSRIDYLRRHLQQLHRAVDEKLPVNGYYHWSLLDNFEWAEGYRHRFGLIYVDYKTQRRTLKQSAHWYRKVIASNGDELG